MIIVRFSCYIEKISFSLTFMAHAIIYLVCGEIKTKYVEKHVTSEIAFINKSNKASLFNYQYNFIDVYSAEIKKILVWKINVCTKKKKKKSTTLCFFQQKTSQCGLNCPCTDRNGFIWRHYHSSFQCLSRQFTLSNRLLNLEKKASRIIWHQISYLQNKSLLQKTYSLTIYYVVKCHQITEVKQHQLRHLLGWPSVIFFMLLVMFECLSNACKFSRLMIILVERKF